MRGLGVSFQDLRYTYMPPTAVSNVVTIKSCSIRQNGLAQAYGITRRLKQRVDYGQGRFSIGLLTPGTGV